MGFARQTFKVEPIPPLVWYDIERDEIFINGWLDACFYQLIGGVNWDRYELLGPL